MKILNEERGVISMSVGETVQNILDNRKIDETAGYPVEYIRTERASYTRQLVRGIRQNAKWKFRRK